MEPGEKLSDGQELEEEWTDDRAAHGGFGGAKTLCVMKCDGYMSSDVCPTQRTHITRYILR